MESSSAHDGDLRQHPDGLSRTEFDRARQQLEGENFDGCVRGPHTAPLETAKALISLAARYSIAPVSGFHVGAIAISSSGQLYLGANMEFAGLPLSASLHAEQSAVLNAWIHGETRIETLLISQPPCGHCRQFLWELPAAAQLQIIVDHTNTTLANLLPQPFGPPRKPGQALLDSAPVTLVPIHQNPDDATARHALHAAQHSYTPYTQAPEGCAIECNNGRVFSGRTAESAAFNPTVPALTCALNQHNLSSSRLLPIRACAHTQLANSLSAHNDFSKLILRKLTPAPMKTVAIKTR